MSASCARGSGENYVGTIAVTKDGDTCLGWDASYNSNPEISKYPGISALSELENYCRNPDGEPRPWCYKNTDAEWAICNVPCCPGE